MVNIQDNTEPFSIDNPSRNYYKFLFRVPFDEDTQKIGIDFVTSWLEEKGKTIKRQKIINMPMQGMFQVRVWLN